MKAGRALGSSRGTASGPSVLSRMDLDACRHAALDAQLLDAAVDAAEPDQAAEYRNGLWKIARFPQGA
jgi:hypothetical protein